MQAITRQILVARRRTSSFLEHWSEDWTEVGTKSISIFLEGNARKGQREQTAEQALLSRRIGEPSFELLSYGL